MADVVNSNGMPTYGLDRDFPTLWDDVTAFDLAERMGGCTNDRLREIDGAMHELWDARRTAAERTEKTEAPGVR